CVTPAENTVSLCTSLALAHYLFCVVLYSLFGWPGDPLSPLPKESPMNISVGHLALSATEHDSASSVRRMAWSRRPLSCPTAPRAVLTAVASSRGPIARPPPPRSPGSRARRSPGVPSPLPKPSPGNRV